MMLQVFAREVMEKVRELDDEKMKTEKAFYDFLPKSIVSEFKQKQGMAEKFDCVTVLFGDIVGLTELTSDCTATEVGDLLLNDHGHEQGGRQGLLV